MKLKALFRKTLTWYLLGVGIVVLAVSFLSVMTSRKAPPLSLWHTVSLREMTPDEIDASGWDEYLAREEEIFAELKAGVTDKLPPSDRIAANRYYEASPIYSPKFETDWNRSYILFPDGEPVGAVALFHGLTDSPYSLRHVADFYRERGYLAVGVRLPGHGTVPSGLAHISRESWISAAKLAVREAARLVPDGLPLHIVGYSNGAALAMMYALEALRDDSLASPHRLIFFSPMVGITSYARYAGLAALPALLPRFAKTAWLSILPEYNPFKYNSFPINGASQSYKLTKDLQGLIHKMSEKAGMADLPPIISFQSLMDDTVSTSAIFRHLYEFLPENGSEIVIFDINRAADLTPLIKPASDVALKSILPPLPLRYVLTVVANDEEGGFPVSETRADTVAPGSTEPEIRRLGLEYPTEIFSLSHVAVPFPMDDSLYGIDVTDEAESEFGLNLGTLRARGEVGMLLVRMESIFRTTSNPFFPYILERLGELIDNPIP